MSFNAEAMVRMDSLIAENERLKSKLAAYEAAKAPATEQPVELAGVLYWLKKAKEGLAMDAFYSMATRDIDNAIAAEQALPMREAVVLSHAELCLLSRMFNSTASLRSQEEIRINGWLKSLISRACHE